MNEFLKKYDDMTSFVLNIDRQFVDDVIQNLCSAGDFVPEASGGSFRLYRSGADKRSFFLTLEIAPPFYSLSVKCRTDDKHRLLSAVEEQLRKTEELRGIPHIDEEYLPDWLRSDEYIDEYGNWLEENLIAAGLI